VEDFTDADLIAELMELDPILAERRPGGITAHEYAALYHVDVRTANVRLKKHMDNGILRRELCRLPDRPPTYVYYKTKC